MPPNLKPMRFAHAEGHTDVCYTDDGKYIITSGHDGEVRVWAGIEDDDNETICVAEEMVNAVAHKASRIFAGNDSNFVQAFTFTERKRDGIITRFTAPITDITVSSSGKLLVSGSCDMEIHISNLDGPSEDIILTGHSAPIIGVDIDPQEQFVVSSSCDGSVRVWDVQLRAVVKTWDCIPKANSFFEAPVLARAAWQPTKKRLLAVPENKEVGLYECSTWSKMSVLSSISCSEPFSLTAFSPCGQFLAAVSKTMICVWDVNQRSEVAYFTHERGYKICALVWNPIARGEIAYCDLMGQLGVIENVLHGSITAIPQAVTLDKRTSPLKEGDLNDKNALKDLENFTFDDDDDDNENVFALDKIKNEVSMAFGDEDDKASVGPDDDARSSASRSPRLGLRVNIQAAFQPSSSPVSLQHRFMVWNSVGIIRCVNNEEENSIDIRFHDSNIHHGIHLSNTLGHTMASLSEQAVVLACPAADDTPSKVVCVALNAWDGTKEWLISLPEGESATAVAIGNSWLAVGTDSRNLRLMCLAGTQRQVITLAGALLCLCGYKEKLFIVFHGGIGLPDEQSLWYQLVTISAEGSIFSSPTQPLPLSPGATLKWAGFSDEGSPCALDSSDMLRLLPSRSNTWIPVCDTEVHAKGKSDHFFLVGVSEFYQNVRAVLCRGAYYPPTAPLPIIAELPLQLPFCEMDTEKSKLEENLWRSQLMFTTMKAVIDTSTDDNDLLLAEKYRTEAEKNMKESLIKLFALSTRGGLEMRAIELCHLMPTSEVAELAAKYAVKVGRSLLADRVSSVVCKKRDKEGAKLYASRARSPDLFASQSQSLERYDVDFEEDSANLTELEGRCADKENTGEKENLLIAAKRKRAALEAEAVEIKPAVLLQSQKRMNPFKRMAVQTSEARGLNLLSSPYNSLQELKKRDSSEVEKCSSTAQKVPKPQPKQMTLYGKTLESSEMDDKRKGGAKRKPQPFTSWFAQNKAELKAEFPDLDSAELPKIGMKRYKEYKEKYLSEKQQPDDIPASDSKKTRTEEAPFPDTQNDLGEVGQDEGIKDISGGTAMVLDESCDNLDSVPSADSTTPSESHIESNTNGISKLRAFAFSGKT